MIRILIGPLLVLVFVSIAAVLTPSRPVAKSILNLPATPYRYANVTLPAHFTQPGRSDDNTPPDNPLSDHGATLGRVLFYDTRLSANNTTSCASCHVQAHAFSDPKPFSKGFHGASTDRRAMPLVNLRYYKPARFFWDEAAGNLRRWCCCLSRAASRWDRTSNGSSTRWRATRCIPCSSRAPLAIDRLPIRRSGRRSRSSSGRSSRTSPDMTRGGPVHGQRGTTSIISRCRRIEARRCSCATAPPVT